MPIFFSRVVLGGTFDHFHLGHQRLINTALKHSQHVIIGITRPHMYHNKQFSHLIQSFEIRKEQLEKYLKENGYINQSTIISLDDIYGNTLEDQNIDAIFATE